VRGVSKTYRLGFLFPRRTVALRGVSLEIRYGEIFCLLGPNGAGKTTLLNILISQLIPDEGEVTIMGRDVTKEFPSWLKEKMNMCSGNPNFPWCMTVGEIMEFYGRLYGLKGARLKESIERYLSIMDLEKSRKTRFDELSTGTKQRLALAKALLNEPEILLLDEPTVGIDPDLAHRIRGFIKGLHEEKRITILLTTHNMGEAEELSDRIAFINGGRVVAQGTALELKSLLKKRDLEEVFIELAKKD
jgi:ABC-2 type transport system ATP-binding protein